MNPAIVETFGPNPHLARGVELSLLNTSRLISIGHCLKATRFLPGDTAEVGIAAGGTTRLIAACNGGKRHWACDTFDGLADAGGHDGPLTNKMFQNELPQVRAELEDMPNVTLVAGYFPLSAHEGMGKFSFVHIDVDTYQSVLNCFNYFSTRMVSGGLLALDDVLPGRNGCPGAQKAWGEIRRTRGWEVFSQTPPQIVLRFA